ncbi:MAG: SPFH domain-containing protein [Chitinophagales bacterium]
MGELPILMAAIAGLVVITFLALVKRYKRCPSDKILVVYGKVGSNSDGLTNSARCIHGGAAFVLPIFQDYQYLDLVPMSIDVNLTNALSRQNIRVDVPSRFTIGISTNPVVMTNAAERLLGLKSAHIQELARDIIVGQLRLVVATMDIEEINSDRDKFLTNIASNVESELQKIGLKLINVNITDIRDESGYIEALGKEAAAKAVNDARKSVAERERDGSIGEAEALRERRIGVAEANATAKAGEAEALKGERIQVSAANANAVDGENLARIQVAESNARRLEKEAEANRIALAAENVQKAKALEESYLAEKQAEEARAQKEKATQMADVMVAAEVGKLKVEIDAEAQAEQTRRVAKGEADAIFFKMQAEARGNLELLNKQAEGFQNLINAAGGDAREAVLMLIADKLPELVRTQVDAIKNLKIDKVTVWDNGGNGNGSGSGTSTANFLSGMYKSVPPLEELFKMAGMELPNYLGKTATNGNGKDHSNGKTIATNGKHDANGESEAIVIEDLNGKGE